MDSFYDKLSTSTSKPAIVSLIPAYNADRYVLKSSPEFPTPLTMPHKPEYGSLNYAELLGVCESIEVSVSKSEAMAIEKETVSQSKSKKKLLASLNPSFGFSYVQGG